MSIERPDESAGDSATDAVDVDGATDEHPDALELLDIARETLVEQLLPQLKGDARYQALMIANAMAMAARELSPGATDLAEPAQLLRGLYEHSEHPVEEAAEDILQRLQHRFAEDLRDGALDGGPQYPVRQLLRGWIEKRLAVSNPRRLAQERERRAPDPATGASGANVTGENATGESE